MSGKQEIMLHNIIVRQSTEQVSGTGQGGQAKCDDGTIVELLRVELIR